MRAVRRAGTPLSFRGRRRGGGAHPAGARRLGGPAPPPPPLEDDEPPGVPGREPVCDGDPEDSPADDGDVRGLHGGRGNPGAQDEVILPVPSTGSHPTHGTPASPPIFLKESTTFGPRGIPLARRSRSIAKLFSPCT